MVDSVNIRHKTRKEDVSMVSNAEKVPSKVNSMGEGNNGEGVNAAIKGNPMETPEHSSSQWIKYGIDAAAAPRTYSVQFFANQKSAFQFGDGKQKNIERVSSRREGGKDETKERVEDFLFLQLHRKISCHKKKWWIKQIEQKNRREALRIKLWDILGTVSSQNKQVSQDPEVGVYNLNPEQNIDKKSKPFVKSRQNSDTIEPDFESPDQTIRRPVTRSLTKKRAPSKVQTNKTRNAPSSTYTRTHSEKNIFSFEERFSGRLNAAAVTNASPKSYRKKRERKGLKAEAHRICFPAKNSADEMEQSPRFEFRTATKNFSPSSPTKNNFGELDDQSPGHCSFSSLLASKPDYYKADVGTESSDDAEELEDSHLMKSEA
ncbi:hypothetical protein Acr_13g0000170 [Actinidia rufa]|uniref:Meiosis-specific protein ASY3-like coiled-coil domain-containing protein n=1 Tax=Actinidia rufa TaxID=165716 RepID=A0A7J0FJL2_9ERIC|nr:hypothetical protein Acr_13g0000170 [Actinidia rufa]